MYTIKYYIFYILLYMIHTCIFIYDVFIWHRKNMIWKLNNVFLNVWVKESQEKLGNTSN